MKYFYFLLISSVFCLSACKKNTEEVVVNDGLIGKWQLVRSAEGIGNGSFAYYNPDPAKPEIIEFKKDSSFVANVNCNYLKTYTSYQLINAHGGEIKFSPALLPVDRNRSYRLGDGTYLKLGMLCIEGCFFEYKAIK